MQQVNTVRGFETLGNSADLSSRARPCPQNEILSSRELAEILQRHPNNPLVRLAGWTLRLDEINDIYGQCSQLAVDDFLPKLFDTLRVDVRTVDSALQRIPVHGPVVIVANHPLGALDGVALLWAVRQRRPDAKIMGNFVLQRVKPLTEALISVDPFDTNSVTNENLGGIRQTLRHIQNGGALVVFPAGEVSATLVQGLGPVDRLWDDSVMKIIQRTKAEVIPAYIGGRNSSLFYAAGKIHPRLRTVLLPSELLRKRDSSITISFAKPVSRRIIESLPDPAALGRFLRSTVYLQSPSFTGNGSVSEPDAVGFPVVAEGVCAESIAREIAGLDRCRLLSQGDFDVYLMQRDSAPNILHEIGRLREITFRQVGEGTGTALDIDLYDRHYEHLVLWHRPSQSIAGSYRLGHGGRIIAEHGINGLYSSTLFSFDETAQSMMNACLELGRSFVRQEFQRQRLPLHLLWRGILTYVLRHPELNAIVGCVSVSDRYREVSKELIRSFFMRRAQESPFAHHVQPRSPFKANLPGIDVNDLLRPVNDDLRLLDKLIAHIEPDGSCCPVLLKKYAQQNAQIVAFNVDPNFTNVLDGFMVLSMQSISDELRGYAAEQSVSASAGTVA